MISEQSAFMYGRVSRSLKSGSLSVPITVSSSACARACTSGYNVMAKMKLVIDEATCEHFS